MSVTSIKPEGGISASGVRPCSFSRPIRMRSNPSKWARSPLRALVLIPDPEFMGISTNARKGERAHLLGLLRIRMGLLKEQGLLTLIKSIIT
jgi:hypothetical protein